MAINIKNAEVDCLIQQLRSLTGQGPTEIVKQALEREYRELRRQRLNAQLTEHLAELQANALRQLNDFDADALYDEDGLPQ